MRILILLSLLLTTASGLCAQTTVNGWLERASQQMQSGDNAGVAQSIGQAIAVFENSGANDPFFLSDLYFYKAQNEFQASDNNAALETLSTAKSHQPMLTKRLPEYDRLQGVIYTEMGLFAMAGTALESSTRWMEMDSWRERFSDTEIAMTQIAALYTQARSSFIPTVERHLTPLQTLLDQIEAETGEPYPGGRLLKLRVSELLGRALDAREGYLDLALIAPPDLRIRAIKAAALIDWRLGNRPSAMALAQDLLEGEDLSADDQTRVLMQVLSYLADTRNQTQDAQGVMTRINDWLTELGQIDPGGLVEYGTVQTMLEILFLTFDYLQDLPDEAVALGPDDLQGTAFDTVLAPESFAQDAYLQRLVYGTLLRLGALQERSGQTDIARTHYSAVWLWPNAQGSDLALALAGLGRLGIQHEDSLRSDADLLAAMSGQAFDVAEAMLSTIPARQSVTLKRDIARYATVMEQAIDAGFDSLVVDPPIGPCTATGCSQASPFLFPWNVGTFEGVVALEQGGTYPDLLAEAFHQIQTVRHSEAGRAIAAMTERLATGDDRLADLLRQRDRLINARSVAESAGLAGRGEVLRIDAEITGIEADLAQSFPAFSAQAVLRTMSLEEARDLLRPDEAMVTYLATDRGLHVFAITSQAVVWHRADVSPGWLRDTVDRLRGSIDPNQSLRGAFSTQTPADRDNSFDVALAHELYTSVLGPVAPFLPVEGTILIAPDDALQTLPFGLLVTQPVADPDQLSAVPWAIRDFAFATLPVPASLKNLRTQTVEGAGQTAFLGVGNPVFDATLQAVSLAPLPDTAQELRELDASIADGQGKLLLGQTASISQFEQADPGQARVIAFATHGLLGGEARGLGEPALALSPEPGRNSGLLRASQIAELSLNADWVILSACNTAAGPTADSTEGLSGLARAFFYAGARKLLVSHWPVQSDATVALTTSMFAALADADPSQVQGQSNGQTVASARALRQAMLMMIDTPAIPRWRHPSAWAPFVVAGG